MYKAFKSGDEAKQELDKQLAAFENELKDGNKKFIGGEPFIIKQMIQILFCLQLSMEVTALISIVPLTFCPVELPHPDKPFSSTLFNRLSSYFPHNISILLTPQRVK